MRLHKSCWLESCSRVKNGRPWIVRKECHNLLAYPHSSSSTTLYSYVELLIKHYASLARCIVCFFIRQYHMQIIEQRFIKTTKKGIDQSWLLFLCTIYETMCTRVRCVKHMVAVGCQTFQVLLLCKIKYKEISDAKDFQFLSGVFIDLSLTFL